MKYTIKKGKHWPQWWWLKWLKLWDWPLFYGDTISYKVRFHKDCQQPYMEQWNKLCGISIGLLPMLHNARFVFDFWQEDFTSDIKLTNFTHAEKQHNGAEQDWHSFEYIQYDKDYILTLTKEKVNGKTKLYYRIGTKLLHSEQTEIPYSKWGWELGAYFGGKKPTTKDCTIEVTQTKLNT